MQWSPVFECSVGPDGQKTYRVGHELVDEFLEFASVRCRPSTVRAYAHDLKIFFGLVSKDPTEVTPKDVLVLHRQPSSGPRSGVDNVVRISDGLSGLSAATIKRRLAAVSSLFSYVVIRGDADRDRQPGAPGDARPDGAAIVTNGVCRWCEGCDGCPGSSMPARSSC